MDREKSTKSIHKKKRHDGEPIPRKNRLIIQIIYIVAVILWILIVYALRVYKDQSIVSYMILAMPIFFYALGFLSMRKKRVYNNQNSTAIDFLALGILFVGVLFEISHHHTQHYTINIIIVAFVLLLLSTITIWTTKKSFSLVQHLRSIFQTAAITLLVYVIWVNVANKVPMSYYGLNAKNQNNNPTKMINPTSSIAAAFGEKSSVS